MPPINTQPIVLVRSMQCCPCVQPGNHAPHSLLRVAPLRPVRVILRGASELLVLGGILTTYDLQLTTAPPLRYSCTLGVGSIPTLVVTFLSTFPSFLRLFTVTLTPAGQIPIQTHLLLGCSDHVLVTRWGGGTVMSRSLGGGA